MKKSISLLLVVLMVLSVVPATLAQASFTNTEENKQLISTTGTTYFNNALTKSLFKEIQKEITNDKKEVRLIIAPKDGYEMKVYEELKKMGKVDPMSKPEYKFIVITISTDKINELRNMDGILKIWLDKQVKIPKPIEDEVLEVTKPVKPNMFMSVYTINAYDAWMDYGVYGDNVTVAVLDTGIDPLQPFLQQTMDGKRKIIDWYDTTGEGYVDTSYNITNASVSNGVLTINQDVTVDWGTYYYLAGRSSRYSSIHINSVKIGNITSANGVYHFGLLPDRYFDMDFDQNFNEAHFVLIVNSSQYYDTVYVDTNDNLDLTDEQPIHIFHSTGDILKFGPGELSECLQYDVNHDLFGEIETICNATLGVVLTEIDPTGKYVNFGWDGGQHGTHVSGTIAGYGMAGTYFEGLYGVAPNAQLMAVRVLSSIGYGSTSWIINGMLYAAIYGPDWIPFSGDEADIISMSLGGLAGYNDGTESPENFYVNYLTELTEVVFSISAGNDGPSTNTVGSPGDADYAITVSNYWESDRWYLLYGFDVIDGPAMSSSRGPRMDGMFDPDVMAPGTDIFSSLPVWSIGDYGTPMSDYYSGTSMAAPHVSGTVALMIDYARQHNLNYDPFKIKEALELSAKKVDGSTMIDQGFGLIQADKAIAELEKLSDENSIVLYAGTTFTPFKNPIEKKLIPYAPINDYMSSMYDIPYLYRGVYLRNELPVTVPIYVYTFKYNQTEGQLDQITGTFQVSAGVNWIIPSVDEVNVGENGSMFYITIDYSRLQKSGTYVGLIYIDDPNTEYLEGYVPVIVYMPINKNGESEAKIIDTEKPGQAKHYYFSVPRGTQELEVTIKIPTDDEGSPLGRTKLVINDPTGSSAEYDGPYIGAGTSYIEYTYHIMKPNAGVWEITAYSSVSSSAYGISEDQYEINVKTYSITLEPSLINKDFDTPGIKEIKATAINSHSDLNVSVLGVGVGKLDVTYPRVENVSQDFIKLVNIIESNESLYYMNVGITQPEDPNADLDLYVWYYETLDQLLNDLNDGIIDNYTNQYVNQIGPTSEEHLELFMPPYGYYLIGVHGYDTAGLNPIHFIYYEQILNDNGDVIVNTTPFEFKSGDTKTITANVNLSEEGTYLGVLGIKDSESGATLTYAPMILQVGQPEMYVALMGTAIIGEPSTLTLQILDMATLEPIQGETNVVINDQVYYAVDGELKFTYTPLSLGELKFNVTVISDSYKDFEGQFKLSVSEPPTAEKDAKEHKAMIVTSSAEANATLVSVKVSTDTRKSRAKTTTTTTIAITVNGTTNETAVIMVTVPKDAENIAVQGEHVVSYYIEKGETANYVFVTVKFASPVTVTITYTITNKRGPSLVMLNYLFYRYYLRELTNFEELYKKALELGVDNETIQTVISLNQTAEEYYKQAQELAGGNILLGLRIGDPRLLASLRKAYLNMREAVTLLQEAIKELESS